jgi:hypothetical protein
MIKAWFPVAMKNNCVQIQLELRHRRSSGISSRQSLSSTICPVSVPQALRRERFGTYFSSCVRSHSITWQMTCLITCTCNSISYYPIDQVWVVATDNPHELTWVFKYKLETPLRPNIQAFMASSDSEDTSLLSTENNAGHERLHDVYLRFSSTRKNIILAMVSGCIVINCMLTYYESAWRSTSYVWVDSMIETFTPSIPQIAKDLNSTGAVVKWSISQDL